jgi:restriction system protein
MPLMLVLLLANVSCLSFNTYMNKVKYLLTYRYAEIIHDLTVEFVDLYIDRKSRTKDQMEQAARSGKQNIVEGISFSVTSKEVEIKLLGVAMSSLEELLMDYEDFLRQKRLDIYPKVDSRVTEFRQTAFRLSHLSNLSDLGTFLEKPRLPGDPQEDANFLLTLCHQATYLLDRQIKAAKQKIIEEGGLREQLFRERVEYRKKSHK